MRSIGTGACTEGASSRRSYHHRQGRRVLCYNERRMLALDDAALTRFVIGAPRLSALASAVKAPRDLINVRFAPLCGLRPDISLRPRSAASRLFGEMLDDHPRSALRAWSVAIPPVARDPPYCWRVTRVNASRGQIIGLGSGGGPGLGDRDFMIGRRDAAPRLRARA